jgi:hypothetical protein
MKNEGTPRKPEVSRIAFPATYSAESIAEDVRFIYRQRMENPENKDPVLLHKRMQIFITRFAYPDLFQEYPKIFESIAQIPISDIDTYSETVGKRLEELISTTIPPEKIAQLAYAGEARERYMASQLKGREVLSEKAMLQCEWSEDEPTIIRIHIASAKTLSIAEKRKEFNTGMKNLAGKVLTDPKLANVQMIVAPSWIIAAHPNFVESLGFTIDPNGIDPAEKERLFPDERRPVGMARMTKEELVRRYS